jgi:DNA (cytosine-5)-methyltransferase 1
MRPCVVQPEDLWQQTCGCGHAFVGPIHQPCPACGEVRDGWTHGDPISSGDQAPGVCFKASHYTRGKDGAPSEVSPPLSAEPGYWLEDEVSGTLDANRGMSGHANRVATLAQPPSMSVRRLTPRECERLQGFPDDWTHIPYRKGESSDSNRYRALGNSMAVPVMRWIGARIARVEEEGG